MNQTYPQGGLAALLASKGRKGDSVLVHMTPGEVEGLQALALATGGSLTTNPDTGLPEANWLKSILPAIAGSALKTFFPKLGSATTGLIVGGISGLVDKSFDKGLRSGLSAYSGAKTIEGLEAARKAVQPGAAVPKIISGEEEVSSARLRDTRTPIDLSKIKVETAPVQTVTKAPSLFGDGVRALFKPEGQEAFLEAVEGPYKRQGMRDLSRSAYFAGLANLLAQEPKKIQPGSTGSNARFYVPGEVNPLYGQGYDQWYFKPGYFSDKYPGYAEGGEVMVSPQAVLPQTLSVSQPAFTQDREGLKDYYESLLVPPGPPRDISDLNAYLEDLKNRLKKPYQPVTGSDWQYGQLPTGGTGGSGPASGGTVTPPGNDPFATGVTGTPIDFIKPPELPPPPKPREDLTPPSSVAPGATPSDLGFLFGTPPEFFVPGTEVESNVEEMEPETETSIEVFDPENIASDYVGAPASVGVPGAALPKKKPPPEQDTQTSIEVFDKESLTSDYAGAPASVAPPTGSSFPARTGYISTKENPFGYDFVELGFINPQTTQEVADASEPIVDEILKNFEEQQKAEKEEQVAKAKEVAGKVAEEVLRAAFPAAATIYDIYKAFSEEKEPPKEEPSGKKATVEVEQVPDKPIETPQTTSAPSGGGSAIPWNSGRSYTLRDLKNPVESEEGYEPDYSVSIPEAVDFAGGGMIPRFSQGGIGSLRQYAVGGKLLNGAGDGMSDDIKANINGTQEARLADGEFVIPADVVSHLGNGSTDAGAKQLYAMMDRIRKARTGRNKQAPEVKARKYMPA